MIKMAYSRHAKLRAKKRNGWRPKTLTRMLERIFYDGLGREDCSLPLRAYIAQKTIHDYDLIRLYGEHVYIFRRDQPDEVVLLTTYPVPRPLKTLAHQTRRQFNAFAA